VSTPPSPATPAAAPDAERLARGEAALGVTFRNPETLRQALTHRSYVREQASDGLRSNERLEFLGDALLGFLVAQILFERFPDAPEGDLTDWRVALIRTETLARWARQRELAPLLYLDRGSKPDALSDRVLGSAFEAALAAIYIDAGLDAARAFLERHLVEADELITRLPAENYKGRLQELVQDPNVRLETLDPAPGYRTPSYVTVGKGPPATDDAFTVEARVDGQTIGTGKGSTKRLAEQAAARDALGRLKVEG
jgi:ribonuclease-3